MDSSNKYNSKEVGLRIKKRAKELGYTVQSLADEMNLEYATVSRIYRGLSVKIEYIYELSEILGVSTDYLLKGKDNSMANENNLDRDSYMIFLSGLSDKELEKVVMHVKIDLGMYSGKNSGSPVL